MLYKLSLQLLLQTDIACSNQGKVLKATKGPQYSNYKWQLLDESKILSTADTVILKNLLNGNNRVVVTALLNGSTIVGDTADIFRFEIKKVDLNYHDYLQCKGDSVLIKDVNTVSSGYDYDWSNGKTGDSLYIKEAGTYTLTKKGPFPSGCTSKDTVEINYQLVPTTNVEGRKLICVGDPVYLKANLTQTPAGTISYEWQNNSGNTLSTTDVLETTTNTSTSYKLKVTESATLTCTDSSYVYIDVNPALEKGTELDDATICLGESYTTSSPPITGGNGGPYTYSWSSNNEIIGSTTTLNFTPAASSQVKLSVTDANDCVYVDDFEIDVNDLKVSISDNDSLSICENDSLLLSPTVEEGVEPYTYLWTLPDNSNSPESSLLIKTEFGEYSLKLTDALGCFDYDTIQLNAASGIRPIISEIDGPNEIIYNESAEFSVFAQTENFELSATSNGLGEVQVDGNKFVYIPAEEEEEPLIQVEIFNICGSDDSSFILKVVAPEIIENILFIPNTVILSASKEESKVFKIYSETIVNENFELKIFSSKGDLVYEESSYLDLRSSGWKPEENQLNFTGKNVFTFITKGEFENGESFDKTGTITVVQ